MKFNYRDKTPKLDVDNNEFKEVEGTNISTNNEVEDNKPNENTSSNDFNLEMPSFEDFMSSSESSVTPELKSFSEPDFNFNEQDFKIGINTPDISVGVSMDDLPEPEPEPELPADAIHGETTFEINPIFTPIPDDIKNDRPEIITDKIEEEKPISDNFFGIPEINNTKEEIGTQSAMPDDFLDFSELNDNTEYKEVETPTSVPDDFVDFAELNNKTADKEFEPPVAVSSDLDIDEVFDVASIKPEKEKKSLFGKKNKEPKAPKEKAHKEPKEKKEKKSLFGKKNKKSNMLDKLDEISQTEIKDDTLGSDLLVGFGLADSIAKPEENEIETNNEQSVSGILLDKEEEDEEMNTSSEISENALNNDVDKTNIPSVLFENEVDFFPSMENTEEQQDSQNVVINSTNTTQQEETPSSILDEPTPIDTPNVSEVNNSTVFEEGNTIPFNIPGIPQNEPASANKNAKKKIPPLVWVVIAIVVVAIVLCLIAGKMLFSKKEPANQIPQNTPPVQQSVEIDTETVNGIVEETQQIVDNANEVADTYQENNELPPQVGIDIDEEINAENEIETPKNKVFTDGKVSFSYPSEWSEISSFNTRKTDDNISNIVMLGVEQLDVEDTNNMRITVEETLTSITAKDYLQKTEELMKNSFKNIKTRKSAELTIAGREAPSRIYTFEDESGNSVEQFQIYIANGGDMYVITFTSAVESFSKNLETYKEILKTLQIN